MPQCTQEGVDLIKHFEGCVLHAYRDPIGIWTIGYGHTPAVQGQIITEIEASAILSNDLQKFEEGVNALCAHAITRNQFSALVCFTYNIGLEALAQSTLLKLVNAGNYAEAQKQFAHWVYADGNPLPGLVARRAAEATLFAKSE